MSDALDANTEQDVKNGFQPIIHENCVHSGMNRCPAQMPDMPLVVDLDGSLTRTDTLVESILQVIRRSPLNVLRLFGWLLHGRALFKHRIALLTQPCAETLPYHSSLLAYLRSEKSRGRRLILATAAHERIAHAVSDHLGLFDRVLASNQHVNLKGAAKLKAIQAELGPAFAYAGDSRADIPIWQQAQAAVLVGVSPAVANTIRASTPIECEFPRAQAKLSVWLRALRLHQWLKNLLLFVPLLTSFSLVNMDRLLSVMLGFLAFSLAASATYVVNDLWDLENDRAHPRKRRRPFASGQLPILQGLAVAALLLGSALLMAAAVSPAFLLMVLAYLVSTSAYSWALKNYVLIDVLLLSLLYTFRILAGSVAIGVATSSWLLAFSVFVFLSLALVKRCSELVSLGLTGERELRGRDYRATDLVVLWPLGVGAAISAVVVFGLFISAPETQARYSSPQLLWLVALGLIYWLARLWIKTARGEMHDDPMVYALKDRGSRITVMAMVGVMLAAHVIEGSVAG